MALLSKTPLEDVRRGLPGDDGDDHARYIEAVVSGPRPVRVASIYLPNGNPIGTEKFAYKLRWMERLNAHARELLALEEPLVLAGDYNVIPEPDDADDPAAWAGDALFQPESRAAFRGLKWLGLTDAYMAADGAPGGYTFWDYQAGAWHRNHGIRIDHLLLSPQAADRLGAWSSIATCAGGRSPRTMCRSWRRSGSRISARPARNPSRRGRGSRWCQTSERADRRPAREGRTRCSRG